MAFRLLVATHRRPHLGPAHYVWTPAGFVFGRWLLGFPLEIAACSLAGYFTDALVPAAGCATRQAS